MGGGSTYEASLIPPARENPSSVLKLSFMICTTTSVDAMTTTACEETYLFAVADHRRRGEEILNEFVELRARSSDRDFREQPIGVN
jgi:hypothetical protein